jgi:hypothetical protein
MLWFIYNGNFEMIFFGGSMYRISIQISESVIHTVNNDPFC